MELDVHEPIKKALARAKTCYEKKDMPGAASLYEKAANLMSIYAEQALGRPVAHEVVARRPGDVARIWAGTNLAERLLGWTASRGLTEMLVDHWRWQEAHPDGYGN